MPTCIHTHIGTRTHTCRHSVVVELLDGAGEAFGPISYSHHYSVAHPLPPHGYAHGRFSLPEHASLPLYVLIQKCLCVSLSTPSYNVCVYVPSYSVPVCVHVSLCLHTGHSVCMCLWLCLHGFIQCVRVSLSVTSNIVCVYGFIQSVCVSLCANPWSAGGARATGIRKKYPHPFVVHTYIHAYIHTEIQKCRNTYIHTDIRTYIHTWIHGWIPILVDICWHG